MHGVNNGWHYLDDFLIRNGSYIGLRYRFSMQAYCILALAACKEAKHNYVIAAIGHMPAKGLQNTDLDISILMSAKGLQCKHIAS
jgi:hypothetical protein